MKLTNDHIGHGGQDVKQLLTVCAAKNFKDLGNGGYPGNAFFFFFLISLDDYLTLSSDNHGHAHLLSISSHVNRHPMITSTEHCGHKEGPLVKVFSSFRGELKALSVARTNLACIAADGDQC